MVKDKKSFCVAICNPPLSSSRGIPLLTQNRQFQWFRSPVTAYTIFPVVSGYAATLLKSKGYEVVWEDGVAERKSYKEFIKTLRRKQPDIIAIESKTPVIKKHWEIVDDLKKRFKKANIVLMGDHVTALPEESFKESAVDYVLRGGDFDFLLLDLANHLSKNAPLGPGIYCRDRKGGVLGQTADQRLHNLEELPIIDRTLTKWWLYAKGNGNFKYSPNTYTMVGRDCWWRKPSINGKAGCTFCSWTSLFPTWRTQSPEKLLNEIGRLIDLGVKEVFDDTGTFPIGKWLQTFCEGMIERGYHKKIVFGCNMRAGALTKEEFELMGKAGFRFILYGLESANQKTIDRLNKGTTPKALETSLRLAKQAGLAPHVTIMFGYPWESKKDAQKTVDFSRRLFSKGYLDTLQATVMIPYPGTALYDQAQKNNWLLTTDYDRFDMSEPVLTSPMTDQEIKKMVRACYHAFWSGSYILRRLREIKTIGDARFLLFLGTKYMSKLLDFQPKNIYAKLQILKIG